MAYVSDVTYKRGVKDTADVISQEKPLVIGDKIWMYHPNRNQALGWVLAQGRRNPTPNRTMYHLEDAPFPQWVEYAGSNESSQTGTLTLSTGHGARVTLGSRIYFPRTEQIIRIGATSATDVFTTITRNFGRGNSTTSLLKTGDKGLLLTPTFNEGFTTPAALSNAMVLKTFRCHELSVAVSATYPENAEISRGGNPFDRAMSKALMQTKDMMEGDLIWSGVYNDSTTAAPIMATEGLTNFISTHVYSQTYMSRMDFWSILAEWTSRNKEGGAIWCSTAFKNHVTQWALAMTQYTQSTGTDGMVIDQIRTPSGTFDLIVVDVLDHEPTVMGTVLLVPRGRVEYRPLVGYENLDIRFRRLEEGLVHSKYGEIYGVYGWHFYEEEMFGMITDLRFAA